MHPFINGLNIGLQKIHLRESKSRSDLIKTHLDQRNNTLKGGLNSVLMSGKVFNIRKYSSKFILSCTNCEKVNGSIHYHGNDLNLIKTNLSPNNLGFRFRGKELLPQIRNFIP